MPIKKYIKRFQYIDSLVRRKGTGNIKCLSKKLNLSRSSTLEHLKEMKELGFPIKYSKERSSYFYEEEGNMVDRLFVKEITREDLKAINGGKTFIQLFLQSENTGL